MFRTLTLGFVLGLVATVAAVYYIPVVDQHRESSVTSVAPNGGNSEAFYVNIPMDRIMVGVPNQAEPVPPGLDWPFDPAFADVRAELFKIRNAEDVVVGVASRMAAQSDEFGETIEWVVHLPARGSFFASIAPESSDGVRRVGSLRAGSREFRPMRGSVSERWISNINDVDEEAPDGRIEISTLFVGEHADDDLAGDFVEGAL
jgi:hypothetical protein